MSTTFGILKDSGYIKLIDDELPIQYLENIEDNFLKVALRNNNGELSWTNEIAPLLNKDTIVYPLDNTAQGIHSIGDIKKVMKIVKI